LKLECDESLLNYASKSNLRRYHLRPNISLRNAAHEWLNAHAWAYADIVKPDAPLE